MSSMVTSIFKSQKKSIKNSMLDVKFKMQVEGNFSKQHHDVLLTYFCFNCYDNYSTLW